MDAAAYSKIFDAFIVAALAAPLIVLVIAALIKARD